MKTVEEHNRNRRELWRLDFYLPKNEKPWKGPPLIPDNTKFPLPAGIACPSCPDGELRWLDSSVYTMYPPLKEGRCNTCGTLTTVVA